MADASGTRVPTAADASLAFTPAGLRALRGTLASWAGADLVAIEQVSREGVETLFRVADAMRDAVEVRGGCDLLRHRVLATAFYEPSTRTSCSFAAAMQRAGGGVIAIDSVSSSVAKGETLADTVRCLECYADVIALRHPEAGAARAAADAACCPVINAGDGTGEHPTQALLDLYTIRSELGRLSGLRVLMVGDLRHGRTVHSLSRLLAMYGAELLYLAPEGLGMPSEVQEYVASRGCRQAPVAGFAEVVADVDVMYVTRIQKERFASHELYEKSQGVYVVTKDTMALCKRKMCVMHPLPRTVELASDVDADPRAAYFRQMRHGMHVRMALLCLVLGRAPTPDG